MLAGQVAMSSSSAGNEVSAAHLQASKHLSGYSVDSLDGAVLSTSEQEAEGALIYAPSQNRGIEMRQSPVSYPGSDRVASAARLASSASAAVATPDGRISRGGSPQLAPLVPAKQGGAMRPEVQAAIDEVDAADEKQMLQQAISFLLDAPTAVPYKLPRHPTHLYHQQTDLMIKMAPHSVVWEVNKWQDANPLVTEPFERVLRKLPEEVRPSSAGPIGGPFLHPNEPIWFEMVHRLNGILKRQGRRADRRKKRRLKSKLFRGRSKHAPTKRDEGKDLREYLDKHKEEMQQPPDPQHPGGRAPGEFLGKVHENYIINREVAESQPFRFRSPEGPGTAYSGGKKNMSAMPPRKQKVVRPVYVPPPPSSMMGR